MSDDHAWQPIETAPKDGTSVFLYFPGIPDDYAIFPSIGIGRRGRKDKFWEIRHGFVMSPRLGPTYWMPLPPPPSPETKDAGR